MRTHTQIVRECLIGFLPPWDNLGPSRHNRHLFCLHESSDATTNALAFVLTVRHADTAWQSHTNPKYHVNCAKNEPSLPLLFLCGFSIMSSTIQQRAPPHFICCIAGGRQLDRVRQACRGSLTKQRLQGQALMLTRASFLVSREQRSDSVCAGHL